MKIGMVQLQVLAGDAVANRTQGLALVEEAAAHAQIIVLPELWTIGYALHQVEELAEDPGGQTLLRMAEIAQEKGVTIIAGSLPLRHAGKVYNSAVVIDHQGQVAAHYDKIHLFSMTGEERFFAPGSARTIFSLGDTTAGLAICYDLRFPELFRALTLDGAQIIFLPAVWPLARKDHWHTLIRARAIENQVYFCAVNCVGHYRGSDFYGHSLLVGPSGETIAGGGAEEAIVYGEFNQDVVTACRQKMQVWHDRRPEVYR